ncbi:hypothetical protein PMAYCL1PPCAC_12817 [Pristionchus mayeri]|uniref:Uncharacterized protein n=1 Tax=Pristionchus mayeri TaxID=1317129 RepID=A0AAN4ZJV0_9BILA|nr:hypothetical protein PMAYCL1PPCAC_12817 [Pristionchus mayeri]
MVLPLLVIIATLTGLAAAYYYYERAIRPSQSTAADGGELHQSSLEEKLYRTDQSIDSSASSVMGLAATSPAFTSEDDKRSPRRRYCPPHLISLPNRSPRNGTCANPAHASHPSHQTASPIGSTQNSCSPFRSASTVAFLESALATSVAETPLEEDKTQTQVDAECKCAVVPLKRRKGVR